MSEEQSLAQGPYVAARVGFEPATLRTEGTQLTTEPPRPAFPFLYAMRTMTEESNNVLPFNMGSFAYFVKL